MRESGVSLDAPSVRPTGPDPAEGAKAYRRRLPDVRNAVVHHFSVGGQEGYLTVGLYEDGVPGEIFIRMAKEGSTVSGLMDCFATAVSLALAVWRAPSACYAGSSATHGSSPADGRE